MGKKRARPHHRRNKSGQENEGIQQRIGKVKERKGKGTRKGEHTGKSKGKGAQNPP